MPNFMMVYRGDATDMDAMTPETQQAIMAEWGVWYGKIGDAVVDGGAPFSISTSIKPDGTTGNATNLTGYTVVKADDLAGATALTDGHPLLNDPSHVIDIFECVDMGDGAPT